MEPLELGFDLDDTLIPNAYSYNRPMWQCGLIISKALGYKSPYPVDLLKLHYEVDSGMVQSHGLSQDRFPESWVRTYEIVCERARVAPRANVKRLLHGTAAQFREGPYKPFRGVKRTLILLRGMKHRLHLITAGDARLQERKIKESGLGPMFHSIAITDVDKRPALAKIAGASPRRAVMVGDSKKSDILPAIELGMIAVHVPSQTWAFANADVDPSKYHVIESVTELPALLRSLAPPRK